MSNKDALHAYLLKNYGSNDKHKKKKKKKQKKATINTIETHDNTNQNVKDNTDDYVMKMPNLNDGSGWNTHTKNLTPHTLNNDNNTTNRKRKHNDSAPISSPSTKRAKRQRYDTDTDSDCDDNIPANTKETQIKIRHDTSEEDNDSDIDIARKPNTKHSDSDSSDIKVHRNPIKCDDYDSDSDIEVTRKTDEINTNNDKSDDKNLIKREKRKNIASKKRTDESMEWASGLTQKYEAFEKAVLAQREKYKSIARYKDDAEMNRELQSEYNAEDPLHKMEGYGPGDRYRKGAHGMDVVSNRPMYRGKSWPNRYDILAGYRWDGLDRSNGFERKKLLHASQRIDHKKKRYQWAISDM